MISPGAVALGHVGLAQVHLGHALDAHAAEPLAQPRLQLGPAHQGHPGHLGQRLPGDVVLGRAQAAGQDDRVGPAEGLADGLGDAFGVVPDHGVAQAVPADVGQALADPGGVGVDDLAEQQLGPDPDDLAAHARSLADGPRRRGCYPAGRARGSGPWAALTTTGRYSPTVTRDAPSTRTTPSASGASRKLRPSTAPSASTRSTSTSSRRPTQASWASARMLSCNPWARSTRARAVTGGTRPSRSRAAVPSSGDQAKNATQSRRAASRNASSWRTSAARSPGKPRMKLERKAASGSRARIRPTRSRKDPAEPPRRMRRSTGALACCSDRSK